MSVPSKKSNKTHSTAPYTSLLLTFGLIVFSHLAVADDEPFPWVSMNGTCNINLTPCEDVACMIATTNACWGDVMTNACPDNDPETDNTASVAEVLAPVQVNEWEYNQVLKVHCDVNGAWRVDIPWKRPVCKLNEAVDPETGVCDDLTASENFEEVTGIPEVCTGQPCNIDNGNKILVEQDYEGPGLDFYRTYNSFGPKGTSDIGSRWMHSYGDYLDFDGSGTVIGMVNKGGYFIPINSHSSGIYYGLDSSQIKLEHVGSEYLSYESGGQVRVYDDTSGRLIRVEHLPGQATTISYDANDQIDTITGPFGHTLEFTYNADDRINRIELPTGYDIVYGYTFTNGNYRLNSVNYPDLPDRAYYYEHSTKPDYVTGILVGANNRITEYSYEPTNVFAPFGRVESSGLVGGIEESTFNFSSDETTVTDAEGNVKTYSFSPSVFGMRKLESVSLGSSQRSYTYESESTDPRRRRLSMTDELGNTTTYGYDDFHRTSVTEASGTSVARTTDYEYLSDVSHRITKITTPSVRAGEDLETVTTYNSMDLPDSITINGFDPSGNSISRSTSFTYNASGQILTIDGPRTDVSNVTTIEYYDCTNGDECGQLKKVTNALGHVTNYDSYDAHGRITQERDPNGLKTNYYYNGRYGPSNIRQQLPSSGYRNMYFYYNQLGLVRQVAFTNGMRLDYVYDAAQQLTSVTDNFGNEISYSYDSMGNRTDEDVYDSSSALQRAVDTAYDAWNRVDTVNNGGFTTDLLFDDLGNLTDEVDPALAATTHSYDALNRLTETIDALSGSTDYDYDINNNLVSVTAPNGANTTYEYDDLGNLLSESSPDRGLTTYTYDDAGNRLTKLDARGKLTTYTYDALNRVTDVLYDGGATVQFVFDTAQHGKGRLHKVIDSSGSTEWWYNSVGGVTKKTQTIGTRSFTTTYYLYKYNGRLDSIKYPSNRWVNYTYSSWRPVSVKANNNQILTSATYEPFGPVSGWTWGNGTAHSRNFDLRGLMEDQSIVTDTRTLGYDAAGHLITLNDSRHVLDFDYDVLGRIEDFTASGSAPLPASQAFTYDANGNRESFTEGSLYNYTNLANSNRLLSTTGPTAKTYTYDAAGNVIGDGIHTYAYGDNGRLVSVDSGAITYEYNGLGQRVKKDDNGTVTLFVYDDDGSLRGEYTDTGALIMEHVYFNGAPVALMKGSSDEYYVHTDHLGTPRVVSDGNTVVWRWESDPFGATAAQEDPDGNSIDLTYNIRFPGQYFDSETSHHYNYFRNYDPGSGRYMESDPIGLAAGANTYGYVGGNPMSAIDPLGLDCISIGTMMRCSFPGGGVDFRVPAPEGQPTSMGRNSASDLFAYHKTNVEVPLGNASEECVVQKLIENPTPGDPVAATPEGARNNARVFNQNNMVTSYLTKDLGTKQPIVVNVADQNSLLFPGYIARTVKDGKIHTYGEGLAWEQRIPIGPDVGNWYYWKRQMQRIVDECLCEQ